LNYIALAIPLFFVLIAVEIAACRLLEKDSYRLNDSFADLSCGVLQQVAGVFLKTALFAGYLKVYSAFRLFEVPIGAAWAWVACYLGHDFLYYWFHRVSHEVNAGWAAHVVHHQSEEYNLTVALRQGALQPAVSWVFYLPLALVGFPPAMFLVVSSLDSVYQFWIHTRLVGRLGPLEWVLNTPSHHRVHHARNPRYIDRNHGGTLIVWDRLFGTFVREEQEPVYGVTRPLQSFNPLWANLDYWAELAALARRARRPLDRLRLLWARPGWRPADLGGPVHPPEVDRASHVKYDVKLGGALRGYVLVQLLLLLAGATVYLQQQEGLGPRARGFGAVVITWSVASLGAILDGRRFALPLEASRLLVLLTLAGLAPIGFPARLALAGLVVASCLWLARTRRPLPLPAGVG
jgi:sterol desaturase/sphingolipid hydroxylase (fatty acid hydroxylase superfamily)